MDSSLTWHLLKLKPNGFRKAIENLERQRVTCFMPLKRGLISRRNRHVQTSEPLFPGYLFIQKTEAGHSWTSINSTLGVSGIVSFSGGIPSHVPGGLIEELQDRCDAEGYLLPPDDFKIGEKVKITSGPFANMIAEIESLPSEGRLGVLLQFLGEQRTTKLEQRDIERTFDD